MSGNAIGPDLCRADGSSVELDVHGKQAVDGLGPQAAGYDQNSGTVERSLELSFERQRADLIDNLQNLHMGSPVECVAGDADWDGEF